MRLISFDIGIKNMAYCVFDVSGECLTIVNWNSMNLMESGENREIIEKPRCSCQLSSKPLSKKQSAKQSAKHCTKVATYKQETAETVFFYCDKHAETQTRFLLPTAETTSSFLKKQKKEILQGIAQLRSIPECLDQAQPLGRPQLLERIERWFRENTLEKIALPKKAILAGDTDLILIGRHMKTALESNPIISECTHVIMENQISPIATRMKTIQGMLAQYFIMKDVSIIEFISSSNKLKLGISPVVSPVKAEIEDFPNDSVKTTNTYKENKLNGAILCTTILDANPLLFPQCPWRTMIQQYKKKDDLFDACLQGLWYLQKKKLCILPTI